MALTYQVNVKSPPVHHQDVLCSAQERDCLPAGDLPAFGGTIGDPGGLAIVPPCGGFGPHSKRSVFEGFYLFTKIFF